MYSVREDLKSSFARTPLAALQAFTRIDKTTLLPLEYICTNHHQIYAETYQAAYREYHPLS